MILTINVAIVIETEGAVVLQPNAELHATDAVDVKVEADEDQQVGPVGGALEAQQVQQVGGGVDGDALLESQQQQDDKAVDGMLQTYQTLVGSGSNGSGRSSRRPALKTPKDQCTQTRIRAGQCPKGVHKNAKEVGCDKCKSCCVKSGNPCACHAIATGAGDGAKKRKAGDDVEPYSTDDSA